MSISLHPNLLEEAFLYFAKFPRLEGVKSSMFRMGSTNIKGYDSLKTAISELSNNSITPEILNFLFSANEEKLKSGIEDTKGIFMLLDYGQLSSSLDNLHRQNDESELGIIIAQKMKQEDYDMAEILLIQDQMLNIMRAVREQMRKDSVCNPFVQQLKLPSRISPWYARELCNATGFSMNFTKSGVEMI